MALPRGIAVVAAIAGVSVALNIFMVAGMLGHGFRGPPTAQDIAHRFTTMLDRLPADDQPVAHEILERHMDDLTAKWRVFTQSQQHANELLRATPFDADQIRTAFEQSNDNSTEFRKALQETQLEIRSKISSEGAKKLHGPSGPPPMPPLKQNSGASPAERTPLRDSPSQPPS